MDPTTTLITFMLQTCPSVQTVHLFGSWDNFSCHTMERDARRGRGEWRGCHKLQNIVSDGDKVSSPSRNAGLKMGQTYYYYYELDGSTETYDPAHPTTNACPFLPGQTVNTLEVPTERSLRRRSASMNSLRSVNFRTMNPRDRFTTPRPAPPAPGASEVRVGSSPSTAVSETRSTRSVSPAPKWTGAARRLFGFKHSGRDEDRGRSSRGGDSGYTSPELSRTRDGARSATPSGSIRSRDMSPESLRRFLSDGLPFSQPTLEASPKLCIPDEIVEENEDDDNFATSAASESAPVTMLSPPPARPSTSSSVLPRSKNVSTTTIVPEGPSLDAHVPISAIEPQDSVLAVDVNFPRSQFSFSTLSSPASPTSRSTKSHDRSNHSFLDESEDDDFDDYVSSNEDDLSSQRAGSKRDKTSPRHTPFTNYSLPWHSLQSDKEVDNQRRPTFGSPELIARTENGVPVGNANLLTLPHIDSGLDDLVSEISWIADVIRPKDL